MYHVVHNTCTAHGRNIKTRYIGLISILRFRKDYHSTRLDRTQSSFKEHFQLIVFRKLFGWKLEKSYTRRYTRHLDFHQRSQYVTNGQELGSKVTQRQEGEVVRQTKFFQSNQPTPSPIRDRSGRLDDMQDGRNTSRSQEINVNSVNQELSSSDRLN